jgi:hypothetical protein
MRWLILLVIVVGTPAIAAAGRDIQPAPSTSVKDLAWLVGVWEFDDRSTAAAGFDYQETGTRTCAWALDDQYIRCESRGTSRGRTRTYVFYFNWNSITQQFDMLSMHPNTPRKSLMSGRVTGGGHHLDLRSDAVVDEGVTTRSWATIVFDGKDRMVWESRSNRGTDPPDAWPMRFREEARRIR